MTLKTKLLEYISGPEYTPQSFEEIKTQLRLSSTESYEAKDALSKLVEEGIVAIIKKGRYVIAEEADLISGIIYFKPNGNAILIPDHPLGTPEPQAITIFAKDTDVALHGDHVLVQLVRERPKAQYRRGKRIPPVDSDEKTAKVRQILHRHSSFIVGTLQKAKSHYFVLPDDPKIVHDILVSNPKDSQLDPKPEIGHKVIVELKEWIHPHLSPEGEITKILGVTHTPMAEYEAILFKYDLSPEFPSAVIRESEMISNFVQASDIKNRLDCRDLFTFTIDPDDAKDFDDALSLEELPNGETRIGIHIADVSYYVKRDTEIDKEAQKRGNSTYLVGTVIPMLPHVLSNGICSLVENEDRLTKTVFITFTSKGLIKESYFANTVIRSNKRMTYKQAYAFLKEDDIGKIKSTPPPASYLTGATGRPLNQFSDEVLKKLQSSVRTLWKFASELREKRMKKGSLDLDMPEVKIFVDKNGYADRIEVIEYDESHQLIEEYMLIANEIVAKTLLEANVPFISRVHDKPDPDKLNELSETLLTFDIQSGDLNIRANVNKLLHEIKNHPQSYTLRVQFLRSLKQACYRASSDGHYGLFKEHYAHFTSPIRRYSDLIVHRIFDNYLVKHGFETATKGPYVGYTQGQLDQLAQHVSVTEQNSTEAERESVKIKLLEFFERELNKKEKTSFKAVITDVRGYGLFIELTESMAFGLIPFSALKDDVYSLDGPGTAAVGRRRGRVFTIGQIIHVKISKIDRFKRQLDFELADDNLNLPVYTERSFKKKPGVQEKGKEKEIKHKKAQPEQSRKWWGQDQKQKQEQNQKRKKRRNK